MAQYYFSKNGEVEIVNYSGNKWLGKLTFGLWDKVGIPRPLSEEDAKLVGRILRNYLKLQKVHYDYINESESGKERGIREADCNCFWSELGYEQDMSLDILNWVDDLAKFFEESGGLITEEEWCKIEGEGKYEK